MATSMFMLTRETQERLADRVLERLNEEFPQHDFIAGSADHSEFENTTSLPMARLEPDCLRRRAFQRLRSDFRDCKPS
jgi:hypothetical protein